MGNMSLQVLPNIKQTDDGYEFLNQRLNGARFYILQAINVLEKNTINHAVIYALLHLCRPNCRVLDMQMAHS